jgi:ubiquinone/menaquinone biosynthesis C-methylase UbiE
MTDVGAPTNAGGSDAGDAAVAQTFYGRWARLYDAIATLPGVGSWRARAVEALELDPGDTAVEMGCGTGANLPYLRERVGPEGTVVGIDFTRGMLDRARVRVERAGWENVHLVRGDATRPPVGGGIEDVGGGVDGVGGGVDGVGNGIGGAGDEVDATSDGVDAVLASFVVGMLADPEGAVGGWFTLLNSGGRLALLDAARSPALRALPIDAAFRLFVVATAPPTTRLRYPEPPWQRLDERVAAARRPLADLTVDRRHETFAVGFVRLTSGRVP